jgi:hypothetical protein
MVASPEEICAFRSSAHANGYRLVRVATGQKRPVAHKWSEGENLDTLLKFEASSANTGLVLEGLRAFDLDIDDPEVASAVTALLFKYAPRHKCLIRKRMGSSRIAVLYRAAEGTPGKYSAVLTQGKVEVLGKGQQLVVDGLHPSGARLEWTDGVSPAVLSLEQLACISEDQVSNFLSDVSAMFPKGVPVASDIPFFARHGPVDTRSIPNDLAAGIEPLHWFAGLGEDDMKNVVAACLDGLDNRAVDPRERWLKVLFAVADADRLGCSGARQLAVEWSRRGVGWTDEASFDQVWNSARTGRTSIGTLLYLARDAGVDTAKLREGDRSQVAFAPPPSSSNLHMLASTKVGAVPVFSLATSPKKRQWLHGDDLVRGAVSLIVAPGARGKSSWLIALALACASGRQLLGSYVFGGPLRVLYINAEDPASELALRVRAAMQHHQMTDADVAGLYVAGADNLALTLLRVERSGPALDATGWAALEAEVARCKPDVLILDPLVALTGGATLNDNAAAALLLRQLVSLAAGYKLAVMIAHHAAKGRESGSAEAAMGAASIVNLARISLAVEPLSEGDAGKIGVAPWEAKSIFRVVGTKQNLSPPKADNRWFRLTSVQMANAEPPVYSRGDEVGVVECFQPSVNPTPFPQAMLTAVLDVIAAASPPLSPAAKSSEYAIPSIAAALAPHRSGACSDKEAKAVLDYLVRTGRVAVTDIQVPRAGRGGYSRKAYVAVSIPSVHTAPSQTP